MATEATNIKTKVQEKYGSLAAAVDPNEAGAGSAQSCCGPTCCDPAAASEGLAQSLYQATELTDLPASVTNISLGCGNPTAIAGLKPGETVLDLGSGGGIDCFLAAKAVGPAGHVIGVDMTDRMLALANQNKVKLGLTNVEFRRGEIEDLPVEDNAVDVIISNCVINLSPDKDAVFQEAFRVLKPGGRLIVSDIVTEGEFSPQLRANVSAWTGCLSGAIDQTAYLAKMEQAGFTSVAVESRSSYGLEDLDSLDAASQAAITNELGSETIPPEVRVYSARLVAYKPGD